MRNDELRDRLHRVSELMEGADRDGWDALSRDLALDDLRSVYISIYGVKLVQRTPKAPVVFTPPVAEAVLVPEPVDVPLSEVKAATTSIPHAVVPEVAVGADRPEVLLRSTQEKEEHSVPVGTMNEEAQALTVAPAHKAMPDPVTQSMAAAPNQPRSDEAEPRILGERLSKPIADLRTGIPLNEKFGLIKNLFGNNASEFQDAILHLNRCADARTLMIHLEEMRVMGNWDPEDPYYLQLQGFVERKGAYLDAGQSI